MPFFFYFGGIRDEVEEFRARSFSRQGFSKETRLDTRIKTHHFGVNTLCLYFGARLVKLEICCDL